jgi:hypothetical protein
VNSAISFFSIPELQPSRRPLPENDGHERQLIGSLITGAKTWPLEPLDHFLGQYGFGY